MANAADILRSMSSSVIWRLNAPAVNHDVQHIDEGIPAQLSPLLELVPASHGFC
jgi:hypothetical protein